MSYIGRKPTVLFTERALSTSYQTSAIHQSSGAAPATTLLMITVAASITDLIVVVQGSNGDFGSTWFTERIIKSVALASWANHGREAVADGTTTSIAVEIPAFERTRIKIYSAASTANLSAWAYS